MLLEDIHMPICLRQFESGVLALQAVTHSDQEFITKIVDLVREKGPVSVLSVATEYNISITMAKEQLLVSDLGMCLEKSD
jgi:ESCRT-II complex subunit VPS36